MSKGTNTTHPSNETSGKLMHLLLPFSILVLTVLLYASSLSNQFLADWDDGLYILNNPDINSIDNNGLFQFIKAAFTNFYNGHYHPITMVVYGVIIKLFGVNAAAFHGVSLLFHLITVALVYYFIKLISKKNSVAFITAVLFAIHPMHVESVAWISDLKDILCTLFYVAALFTYVRFLSDGIKNNLYLTYLFFVSALLSKSMAITLPLVLIVFELYLGKKWTLSLLTSKLPMLLLSAVFGYLSVLSQKSNNALGDITAVSFFDRILFSSYAVIMYLVKLVSFFDLSAFYNYPLSENGKYPMVFYISPIIVVAFLVLVYLNKWNRNQIWFGIVFFILTIALVLQLVPAGNVIMADRYTYLPYLGLFFAIASISESALEKFKYNNGIKFGIVGVWIVFTGFCANATSGRTKVWKDSMSLWDDTIKKNPDAALPYSNRAAILIRAKQFEPAVTDLNKAIEIRPNYVSARFNRALAYMSLKRFKEAIPDFSFVLQNNPRDIISVHMNRAWAYMYSGGYQAAIADFTSALKYNGNLTDAYYNRGLVFHTINQFDLAINDFNATIQLNPKYIQAYYMRALSLYKVEDYQKALFDADLAQRAGYPVDPAFMQDLALKAKEQSNQNPK